ncbi:MAG: phytoene/squalene synthase family protein [Methylophilaceae bacterium]|jgi:15-cis-phytoene synthase|nr:phytoene/squalene synthase family protein [Methylophilaceae bacterium]MDG1453401.1 phytoene/squalene synthase family protein [Methylophilaceae bacterium]
MEFPNSAEYEKHANEILFEKGKTFYWAKALLDSRSATKATRLYRFCRYVDDLADETDDKNKAFESLNQIIVSLKKGTSNDCSISDSIALFLECDIPISIPIELINGVLSDLNLIQIKSENQLLEYCYQVAGTVGIMMCKVLGVSDTKSYYHAIDLGIGMQLTNICRDIHADALIDRIYLPQSMIGSLKSEDILELNDYNKSLVLDCVMRLLDSADHYYRSGYNGLVYLPLRSRFSILIAAKLYQEIGVNVKTSGLNMLSERVFIPTRAKFFKSIKFVLSALMDSDFWTTQSSHNEMLHLAIKERPFCNG